MTDWPSVAEELVAEQLRLASASPRPWRPAVGMRVGACFVCFPRGGHGPGRAGDLAWGAAAAPGEVVVVKGVAGAAYEAGLLALREGPLLEQAFRALVSAVDLLIVNATGRDHPRRAGLALHLGAMLGLPTVGVTHRPLLAAGDWPPDRRGAASPLVLDGEQVGSWLRTRSGTRPLAVHAAWRTDPDVAVEVVLAGTRGARTPLPLRRARRAAREARAADRSRVCDTRAAVISLTTPAFEEGGTIPTRHTCDGDDVSPGLAWTGLPNGTASLALVVDDPDAPGGTFTHWLAWGIDPVPAALAEGVVPPGEGRNGFRGIGYRGPCPPRGHAHRYVFRLYALDAPLDLDRGADAGAFHDALAGHVLGAGELTGTYARG